MIDDPGILANILEILFIALGLAAFFIGALAGLRRIATILVRRSERHRRMNEPETHGDDGGHPTPMTHMEAEDMPASADYSDEVTGEHFTRIAELVDQGKFENAEVVSGPAWIEPELPAFLKRTHGDQAALKSEYAKRRAG